MRITLDQLDALRMPDGETLLGTIAERDPSPAETLALVSGLRERFDPELVAAAMTIHTLRQRARGRFQDADRLWLTGEGLEQASGDLVADYRAARFAGCIRVADLGCGIGGDLMALARRDIGSLLAIDRDPLHAAMAALNARTVRPDVDLEIRVADALDVDLTGIDGVFLDPARRRGGQRVGAGGTSPPLDWAIGLVEHVPKVGITTAPGIAHTQVPEGWEFEAIAIGTDLKEGMLWSPALETAHWRATVIDPSSGEAHTLVERGDEPLPITEPLPGMTVIDPNPAVTRAGLVQTLGHQLGARMIDTQIAFLVTEEPVTTAFARSLQIVDALPWHERRVKMRLRELGAGAVGIRRRGLAGDVDRIARRLRGDGSRRLTVLMTRHRDNPWAIIAEDPPG
ncbi:MAG TPA: class I SAM-dependent methyltransferase [Thermomicrobiales bacterium]|nr:class I SAM-dependent methyltransferase [Thermomicrobiales bacterium]